VVVATPANCGWVGKRRSGPRGQAPAPRPCLVVVGISNGCRANWVSNNDT